MQLSLRDDLIWATLISEYEGERLVVPDILVDTGSASTMLSADVAEQVHITPSPDDKL